ALTRALVLVSIALSPTDFSSLMPSASFVVAPRRTGGSAFATLVACHSFLLSPVCVPRGNGHATRLAAKQGSDVTMEVIAARHPCACHRGIEAQSRLSLLPRRKALQTTGSLLFLGVTATAGSRLSKRGLFPL